MRELTEIEQSEASEAMANAACFAFTIWEQINDGTSLTHERVTELMVNYGLLDQRPMTADELAAEKAKDPNSTNDVMISMSDALQIAVDAIDEADEVAEMEDA